MSQNTDDQIIQTILLGYIPLGIFKWQQLSSQWQQQLQSRAALDAVYHNGIKLDFENTDAKDYRHWYYKPWTGLVHSLSLQAHSGNLRQLKLELNVDRGDSLLVEVAKLLPANLVVLALDLRVNEYSSGNCISDIGVCRLAEELPQSLTNLRLRIRNSCRCNSTGLYSPSAGERSRLTVTDVGVEVLSKHLPSQLKCLDLEFFACNVTEVGAGHIAQGFPQGLEELHLGFDDQGLPNGDDDDGCPNFDRIGPLGAKEISRHLPKSLRKLGLYWFGCVIEDEGLLGLAAQLPNLQCLASLEINLGCNGDFSAEALHGLSMSLPRSVTNLSLSFECDFCIDENAMRALLKPLHSLPCLGSLKLLFSLRVEQQFSELSYGVGARDREDQYPHGIALGCAIREPTGANGVVKSLLQEVPQQFQEHVWVECEAPDSDDDTDDDEDDDEDDQ